MLIYVGVEPDLLSVTASGATAMHHSRPELLDDGRRLQQLRIKCSISSIMLRCIDGALDAYVLLSLLLEVAARRQLRMRMHGYQKTKCWMDGQMD